MKNIRKRIISFVLMLVIIGVNVVVADTKSASAATSTSNVPITGYTLSSDNVSTYKNVNGQYTGYICKNDLCKILTVYDSGWVKVSYPTSKGSKTAYAYSKDFFTDINFSTATTKTGKNMTVYKKADLKSSIGEVYANDSIIVVGTSNGNTQIIYPISGGYKIGFIKGGLSSNSTQTSSKSGLESLCFDYKYYANTYSDLKAAFGYNEEQLYNHWITYGIKEGRSGSPILDLKYYVDNNPDLKKAFGNDYYQAYYHFLNYGYKEFRASSPYYNGDYYRKNNSDLANFDSMSLINHYIQYGISEGRYANTQKYTPVAVSESTSNSSDFDPIWPCEKTYKVTTLYKYSDGGKHSTRFKYGIDIGAPPKENVLAVESGTVIKSEYSTTSGFGNWIMIEHENGKVSLYAHLYERSVQKGKKVAKGEVIGKVGNTSAKNKNMGYHLHFELGDSNKSGAAGDPWLDYYKTKYGNKVILKCSENK